MVKIRLNLIKEKSEIHRGYEFDIQQIELSRLSFEEWSVKMASTGYFSDLFRGMEDYRLNIENTS